MCDSSAALVAFCVLLGHFIRSRLSDSVIVRRDSISQALNKLRS